MRRTFRRLPATSLLAVLVLGTAAGSAIAVPGDTDASFPGRDAMVRGDVRELPPMTLKWQARKALAANLVGRGLATPADHGLVTLSDGTTVEHAITGEDHIVTVLAQFSDLLHGNLATPPDGDNITYVPLSTEPAHYADMLFSDGGGSYGLPSMRDFYSELSSGVYTVDGQVSDWVTLPGTQASYGANSRRGGAGSDDANGPVYRVIGDAVTAAASDANVDWSPATVDVWDRYDCDGNGNYDEPDGYVDHFQVVHAGPGEESGASGDTIWSHRWYANFNLDSGPAACQLGGYQIPGTDLWVGDYTIEPEDGGVGVFAHEFGHDLGLPDLYDTTGGAENGTGFWTLMSSGSWASDTPGAIGIKPTHMGAFEKEFLGWLDLTTLDTATLDGTPVPVTIGPAEHDESDSSQALRINVAPVEQVVQLFDPRRRDDDNTYLWSGRGDGLNAPLRATFDTLGSSGTFSFQMTYDIETDYDYGYVEIRDGDGTWSAVPVSRYSDPAAGNGITGSLRRWVSVSVSVPAGSTGVGFRYYTDAGWIQNGLAVDAVTLNGAPVAWNDPDLATSAWREVVGGTVLEFVQPYYLLASRSAYLNDESLCGGYNWIGDNTVEKFCYAAGLLVTYVNPGQLDNNVSQHPGAGLALPVDLRPNVLTNAAGSALRSRIQVWDAAMTVEPQHIDLTTILQSRVKGQIVTSEQSTNYPASPMLVFHDTTTDAFWNPSLPYSTIHTAGSGVRVQITGLSPDHRTFGVEVTKP